MAFRSARFVSGSKFDRMQAKDAAKRKRAKYAKRSSNRKPGWFWGPTLGTAGSLAGGALGGYLGGPVGAGAGGAFGKTLGSSAGQLVAKVVGFGDYNVSQPGIRYNIRNNTLFAGSGTGVPQFANKLTMEGGSVRIQHKEFIQDILSSATPGAFNQNVFEVSASNEQCFPWLSGIASNYQEYSVEGLIFSYVSASGSISSTQALGSVIMAANYNANGLPFVNKQQMESTQYSISGCPCNNLNLPLECAKDSTPSNGVLYTANPNLLDPATVNDKRWSTFANVTIATQNVSEASVLLGELYVTYDIILSKTILNQFSSMQATHLIATDTTVIASGSDYFGDPIQTTGSDADFAVYDSPAQININPAFNGNFMVQYNIHLNAVAQPFSDPIITGSNGITPLNILNGGTSNTYTKVYGVTEVSLSKVAYFNMRSNGSPGILAFTAGDITATFVDAMDLIVISLPIELN